MKRTNPLYSSPDAGCCRPTMAGECAMNVTIDLQAKINDYLAERRSMGFKLDNMGAALANFARFAANRSHQGPLTTTLMADTTEAIFGLPPMSQWDENASVLSGMWTDHPDYAAHSGDRGQ